MKGTLRAGLDRHKEAVGKGRLTGSVECDQVYAHYQHAGLDFYHPDGGQALYLTEPLFTGAEDYMRHMADEAIDTDGGSHIVDGMIGNMEDLSKQVESLAPKEFEDLSHSGHPVVTSDGATVYDRAPEVGRLGPEELKLKSRIRDAVDPHRYRR